MEPVVEDMIPDNKRVLIGRMVFSFILFVLIYFTISNVLFHQLRSPVLKYPYVDPVYWLMHWLKIPDAIVSNYSVAYVFDIILFAGCIGCIVFPLKRIFVALFLLTYFIYFISFNSYGGHHTHAGIGILLIPIPFLFRKNITFSLLWQALRYYTLFIYVSAFLWKLFRLSFINEDQGLLILKNNVTAYLYYNPGAWLSKIYWWLLQNPVWVNAMYIGGFILEGLFIIGFFTKKYDKYLLLISLIMVIGFWLLADALFFQLLVLSFTLVNFNNKRFNSYI
jgi:hypothetical protein